MKATLDDPKFREDASKLTIRYVPGEEVQQLLNRLYQSPDAVRKAVVEIMRAQ